MSSVEDPVPVLVALSVALAVTVYAPPAGNVAAEKDSDQLVVPVAATKTCVADPNVVPFQ
jgi:hypothetical protein